MIRTRLAPTFALSLILTMAAVFSQAALAAGSPDEPVQIPASQPSAATSTNSISAPFKLNAPEYGPMKLKAGVKSQNTSARFNSYDDTNGKRYQTKQEYYLGAVHASGWGGYAQAVTSGSTYAGNGKDTVGAGDPSLTVLHPDWYRGPSLTLAGQFRSYFPVSDRSVNRNQHQQAYYLYTSYKMPRQWSIWNQTVPRYFIQSYYNPADTTMYIEDLGTIMKQVSTHWSVGVGQWTQVEGHKQTDTGTSIDVEAIARYVPIQNVWIEPRLILPAYVQNAVYDAAPTAALRNARAELYAQLTL